MAPNVLITLGSRPTAAPQWQTKIVIASEAWRSRGHRHSPTIPGSPRRFAPRDDASIWRQALAQSLFVPLERVEGIRAFRNPIELSQDRGNPCRDGLPSQFAG